MKKKTILALILGAGMIMTACGESAVVSEVVENASVQQNMDTYSRYLHYRI